MKRILIPALFLLLILSGCSKGDEGQQVIEEFLTLRSQLYEHQEEVVKLMDNMTVEGELQEGSDEILSEMKSKVDEDAFDRLLGNRMIIDEPLLFGNYVKSEIKNIDFKPVKSDGEASVIQVDYDESLYLDDKQEVTTHHKEEYTLVKKD